MNLIPFKGKKQINKTSPKNKKKNGGTEHLTNDNFIWTNSRITLIKLQSLK